MNKQQNFWACEYGVDYIKKNSVFDLGLGVRCWLEMLAKAGDIGNLLECGCNVGRNIGFLNTVLPNAKKSVIEIGKSAFDLVVRDYKLDNAFNGPIVDADFAEEFDLVFSMGVLIHVHPDDLYANMSKMFSLSRRYVLMGEYFSRTPVMLDYQGEKDCLFKRDFGKFFIEKFPVRLVDYGFLWGHIYDAAGFDDITWWLFEKE